MERAARAELASSGWRPEAPAAIPCSLQQTLAVATGGEPVPPDRQSGILPPDSATTFKFCCEGTIRTCMNRVRAGYPLQLNDLANILSRTSQPKCGCFALVKTSRATALRFRSP